MTIALHSPLFFGPLVQRPCPLCNQPSERRIAARRDGGVWSLCPECDLVFLAAAPSAEGLSKFYRSYYEHYRSLATPSAHDLVRRIERRMLDPLTLFGVQSYGGVPPRVIDVGCGQAARLFLMRAMGSIDVTGCEFERHCIQLAKAQYGIDIHQGDADAIPRIDPGYDLVFFSEVVEHLLDPIAVLKQILPLLRPGGLLCLSTPNAGVRHRAGTAWDQLHIDLDHVTLFSPASVSIALRAAGFCVREILTFGDPPHVSAADGAPNSSGERWNQDTRHPPLRAWAERSLRVARRLAGSLRSRGPALDVQSGYTLYVSATRPEFSQHDGP